MGMEEEKVIFIKVFFLIVLIWIIIPLCAMGVENRKSFNDISSYTSMTWKDYGDYKSKEEPKKKCALVSSIILKSKRALKLTCIKFRWNGMPVKKLFASLFYKRERESDVVPIEENLIKDGVWDGKKQEVSFDLYEKIIAVKQGNIIATAFHPELTRDISLHKSFVKLVDNLN